MKNKKDRINGIINNLRLKGTTNLDNLAVDYNVSKATIRRDIKELEKSGQVVQTIGGGIILRKDFSESVRKENLSHAIVEKIRIAEYCSTLINEQDTVILGPGGITTLTGRILSGLDINFRVVTNSLSLALELSELDNINTYIIGGEVEGNYSTRMEYNQSGLDSIKYANKLFLSADGIDIEHGLTYFKASSMIPMIKQMMEIADEVILIGDSTKFGKICFNRLEGIECVTKIITDSKLDAKYERAFTKLNIDYITV